MTNRRKTLKRMLVWTAVLALVAGLAVSWKVGSQMMAPVPRSIAPPPPALEAVAFEVTDAKGRAVRGWACDVAEPRRAESRGVVLLLHGMKCDRSTMIARAAFLRSHGFASVLVDLHAHGESEGDRIALGWEAKHSVRAAIEWTRARFPHLPLAVVGVSLGGAAAIYASPLGVDAMVLESVYPDAKSAIHHRVSSRLGWLGVIPEHLLLAQIWPRLGVRAGELSPVDHVADIGCPLLLIGGAEDPHTPLPETRRLFDAAAEPKELWVVPDAAHVDLHNAQRDEYERRVLGFLKAALSGTRFR